MVVLHSAAGEGGHGGVGAGRRPSRSLGGRNLPGCKSVCMVHISAASWPIAPLWAGESSKVCPLAATFSPRKFLPPKVLALCHALARSSCTAGNRVGANAVCCGTGARSGAVDRGSTALPHPAVVIRFP